MNAAQGRAAVKRWWPHLVAGILLGVIMVWDQEAFAAIRGFRSPFLTWLTDRVSQLRGVTLPSVFGLLMIAFGLIRKKTAIWRGGIAVVLTVLFVGAVTTVMKELIARPGPLPRDMLNAKSLFDERFGRFPSSHSAVMIGAATVIAAFIPAAAVPAFILTILVCHERIYRGTHFPSDIFAGLWVGFVCARFVIARLARRKEWKEDLERARNDRWTRKVSARVWTHEKPDGGDREAA
jgi:undecaprenyl-diphosphatase